MEGGVVADLGDDYGVALLGVGFGIGTGYGWGKRLVVGMGIVAAMFFNGTGGARVVWVRM